MASTSRNDSVSDSGANDGPRTIGLQPHPDYTNLFITRGMPLRPDEDECPICKEPLVGSETWTHDVCKYSFHPECLGSWLDALAIKRCPCDKQELASSRPLVLTQDAPELLPRDDRRVAHIAELLATDPRAIGDSEYLAIMAENRFAYEDFTGLARADMLERLAQIVVRAMPIPVAQDSLKAYANLRLVLAESMHRIADQPFEAVLADMQPQFHL